MAIFRVISSPRRVRSHLLAIEPETMEIREADEDDGPSPVVIFYPAEGSDDRYVTVLRFDEEGVAWVELHDSLDEGETDDVSEVA